MATIISFLRRRRALKTSAATVVVQEPPPVSACPDQRAAAPSLSPAADALLAGAAVMSAALSVGIDISLTPLRLWAAALSPWSA